MIHAPRAVIAALREIAEEAGVTLEFVCGVAAQEFSGLPKDQRRCLCVEYLCTPLGPSEAVAVDVFVAGADTGRGMSASQHMLTAMWVLCGVPEAVDIVVSRRGT